MCVGNSIQVAAQAVSIMPLHLPSKFILGMNNFYLVPTLCGNIISGSFLLRDGYYFRTDNNGYSIYLKNMFYGFAPIKNGLFIRS